MYRTTAQSRAIEEALRFRGIPYQVIGGVRFYERKEIKDILATLRLLHNPADSSPWNASSAISPSDEDSVRARWKRSGPGRSPNAAQCSKDSSPSPGPATPRAPPPSLETRAPPRAGSAR